MPKILLVEDDISITDNLSPFLHREGYDVDCADGQTEAFRKLDENLYDLVLLDVSLKDGNGFSVCHRIKDESEVPVIFLTASGDEFSVVAGFDAGADDYVPKPFRPRELLSRIKNVLRRRNRSQQMEYKGITIDTDKGTASKNGKDLFLSALEYKLLLIFFNNMGAVLTRTKLLEEIWDASGEFVNDNTLTVYIKRLRDKVEDDPQNPQIIKTVRGMGYKAGD